ncbi:MAG: DUF1097 domain-containing protein [Tannerellaceae bacterium]|jgi:EamA domain-containing membrane protein RarD|nr:DUF1097 domain-containing protein [Tannerellaceae bacterium]
MKKLSFAAGSAYTAALAFIIVVIDQLLKPLMPIGSEKGFTYIAFVAWAVYFFSGCTGKGGIRAAIGYVIGVTFSVGIILIADLFAAMPFLSVPIAVFIVVFIVLYLEKVPWVDLIPAMFVASGCYFGIMTYVPDATFGTAACVEIIYGFIGLLFGWITITGKGILSKKLEK